MHPGIPNDSRLVDCIHQLDIALGMRKRHLLVVINRLLPILILIICVLDLGVKPGLPHRKLIVGVLISRLVYIVLFPLRICCASAKHPDDCIEATNN